MLSLIAALVIAQQPAANQADGWQWRPVKFFGQSVYVYGVMGEDGLVHYKRSDVNRLTAPHVETRSNGPVDVARKGVEDAGAGTVAEAKRTALNYGVSVDQMASDGRIVRASDPETLARVVQSTGKRKPCPDDSDGEECRLGIVAKAENAIEKLIAYGVAAALAVAAAVVFVRSPRPPS